MTQHDRPSRSILTLSNMLRFTASLLLVPTAAGFALSPTHARIRIPHAGRTAFAHQRHSKAGLVLSVTPRTTTSLATVAVACNATTTDRSAYATSSTTDYNDYTQIDSDLIEDIRQQYAEWGNINPNAFEKEQETMSTSTALASAVQEDDDAAAAAANSTGPSEKDINTARLLLLAAAALYGTNFSLVKLLGETALPVGVSSALRFGMAALATSPWLFQAADKSSSGDTTADNSSRKGFSLALPQGPELAATLAGFEVGMWNSVGYVAQAVGLETTAASKSAFLCSLAVVVVPLLDFMAGKLLLSRQVVGAVLALGGVAMLELGGMQTSELTLTSGDIASLIQPVAFGLGFWRMEKAMRKYPDHANRSTAAQLLAVFCGSALYATFTEYGTFNFAQLQEWMSDPMILASLFWTGCITTALTVYMETVALKTLSAAETTLIFSTEPLWGTAFAAVVMGEQLGVPAAIGAVFILSGCVFSNLGVEGIQAFFNKGKESDGASVSDNVATATANATATSNGDTGTPSKPMLASSFKAPFAFPAPMSNEWTLFRTGIAAAIGSSAYGLFDDIDIGAKVIAIQIDDFVETVFPFLVDN